MIRRLLFLFVLSASAASGQSVFMALSGTAGASPTTANLNAATTSCDGGSNSGASPAGLTFTSTPSAPAFPATTTVCSTPLSGNATTSLSWLTGTAVSNSNFHRNFTVTANASVGLYFCIDFNPMGDGAHEYSNVAFEDGGGHTSNLIVTQFGIQLETAAGGSGSTGVSYTGGPCTTDPTAWRWITWNYTNTGTDTMKVYDYAATNLLGTLTGSGVGQGNITLLVVGITGSEGEVSGSHIYWRNILLDPTGATFPVLPNTAPSFPWTGIIARSRASQSWQNAGVVGGIPSAGWTQSGSTIAAYTGTAATINTALSLCGANQYVLLGPGTFTLSTGILSNKSNCELRGSGTQSTIIAFTNGVTTVCSSTLICFKSSTPGNFSPPTGLVNVTTAPAQGTTSIVLSSVTGISPGMILGIAQVEDTSDGGVIFNCSIQYASASSGCSFDGPDGGNMWALHGMQEMFIVQSTNSGTNTVTVDHAVVNPNWSLSQSPQAWFFTPITVVGAQNFTIDGSAVRNLGQGGAGLQFASASNFWSHGVECKLCPVLGEWTVSSVHGTIEQGYHYNAVSPGNVSHAINNTVADSMKIENNICQQINACVHFEGPLNNSVIAYNFQLNSLNLNDNMGPGARAHCTDNFNLFEGNVFEDTLLLDDTHCTSWGNTVYRNFLPGWESCATSGNCGASSAKDFATNCLELDAYNRYDNLVGNVCGTPGFHNTYTGTTNSQNKVEIVLGAGNGATGPPPTPSDPLVPPSTMMWGQYDVVNATVRFVAGENGSGAPTYPALASPSSTFPASFYLPSKPSWFQSLTYPPIGPDVSSGNISQCSGSLNVAGQFNGLATLSNAQCGNHGVTTAWAGHVNANPAMNCALNIMGMPLDGTGSVLSFDPNVCFAGAAGTVTLAPTSLSFGTVPQLATIPLSTTLTNSSGGSTITISSITVSGTNASDFTTTSTCGATLGNGVACTITVSFTPTAVIGTNETATLSVAYTGFAGSPVTAALSGTVGTPLVTVAPSVFAMMGKTYLQGMVIVK